MTTRVPERVTPVDMVEGTPVVGETPQDILDAILADAAQESGVSAQAIRVVRAQSVIWNDGSLGCPQPGVLYTQAQVDGYWVVLEAGSDEYDYRASDSGAFFLCEGGTPPLPPKGTPGA